MLDDVLSCSLGGIEVASVSAVSRHTHKSDLSGGRATGAVANGRYQVYAGAVATGDVALSPEDVGEINSSKRLGGSLAHGGIHGVFQIGVEVESIGIAGGSIIAGVQFALQPLVHESVLRRGDIRVSPDNHVFAARLCAFNLGVQAMAGAQVVVRRLNVVVIPVYCESALE